MIFVFILWLLPIFGRSRETPAKDPLPSGRSNDLKPGYDSFSAPLSAPVVTWPRVKTLPNAKNNSQSQCECSCSAWELGYQRGHNRADNALTRRPTTAGKGKARLPNPLNEGACVRFGAQRNLASATIGLTPRTPRPLGRHSENRCRRIFDRRCTLLGCRHLCRLSRFGNPWRWRALHRRSRCCRNRF